MKALWRRLAGALSALYQREPAMVNQATLVAVTWVAVYVSDRFDWIDFSDDQIVKIGAYVAAVVLPAFFAWLTRMSVYSPATVGRIRAEDADFFSGPGMVVDVGQISAAEGQRRVTEVYGGKHAATYHDGT